MDRLEAMVTIERYGAPENCERCGWRMPSLCCNVEDNGCPLLVLIQASEPEDDVKAIAERIREETVL